MLVVLISIMVPELPKGSQTTLKAHYAFDLVTSILILKKKYLGCLQPMTLQYRLSLMS